MAEVLRGRLLLLLAGEFDLRTLAFKLAAKRWETCPFNEDLLDKARHCWVEVLQAAGATGDLFEVSEGQPFFLRALGEHLRICLDPDWRVLTEEERSYSKGLSLGVLEELPEVPAVFEPKTKHRTYAEEVYEGERSNYPSAAENAQDVEMAFHKETELGGYPPTRCTQSMESMCK